MQFIARTILLAVLFMYGLPLIAPGVVVHGAFWPQGIVAGLLFAGVGFLLGLAAALVSIGTLGAFGIILYILQVLFPAVVLQVMSSWFPERISVANWESAIVAGLCIWLLSFLLTHLFKSK